MWVANSTLFYFYLVLFNADTVCYVLCLWCVFSFTYVMNFIVIIDLNPLLFSCAYAMSNILITVQSALIFK